MEYYENSLGAVAQLGWSSPTTPKQIIPQAQLYSTATPPSSNPSPTAGANTSANAESYTNSGSQQRQWFDGHLLRQHGL
jgi:hypothetical protein